MAGLDPLGAATDGGRTAVADDGRHVVPVYRAKLCSWRARVD